VQKRGGENVKTKNGGVLCRWPFFFQKKLDEDLENRGKEIRRRKENKKRSDSQALCLNTRAVRLVYVQITSPILWQGRTAPPPPTVGGKRRVR